MCFLVPVSLAVFTWPGIDVARILGWSAFAGFSVLLIAMPLNHFLSKRSVVVGTLHLHLPLLTWVVVAWIDACEGQAYECVE